MKSTCHRKSKLMVFGTVLTTTTLFFACMGNLANYGSNKLSDAARDKIENFQVLPDHNYYYTGSNVRPQALIAIHKSYTVSEGIWKKVEPTSKDLKYMVGVMQKSVAEPPYGYDILDPQGKLIGIFYSRWDPWPVKMEGGNKVTIYAPDKRESVRPTRGD